MKKKTLRLIFDLSHLIITTLIFLIVIWCVGSMPLEEGPKVISLCILFSGAIIHVTILSSGGTKN